MDPGLCPALNPTLCLSWSLPTYGTLTTNRFREEDSQAGALHLNETVSANIPLAARGMAGLAGQLKWWEM